MKAAALVLCVLASLVVAPGAFAVCTAAGIWTGGPHSSAYDHIANGGPNRNECWNPFNAFYTNAMTACGSVNTYEFNYGGSINQTFVIPTSQTGTSWEFRWLMDFDDPNNDAAWNRFSAEVVHVNTGKVLAWYTFNGGQGDQSCNTHSIFFTGNYTGQTLRVRFTGSKAYANTHIRAYAVSLWQY